MELVRFTYFRMWILSQFTDPQLERMMIATKKEEHLLTKIFCKNDVRFMMQIKIAKWVVFVIEAELSIATILKCNIFMRRNIYYFLPDSLPIFLTFVTSLILIFLRGWKIFISICLPKSLMKGSSHCDTSKT